MNPSTPTAPGTEAPEPPVFDASVLGALFGPEPALIASVLQTFAAGTQANLAELTQAVAAQDLNAVASLAHRIAGAGRMSGALALGDCARSLELAAKRGDAAAVPPGVAELEAQWALAQAAMATPPTTP